MKKSIILSFAIIACIYSCKKDDHFIAPTTQTATTLTLSQVKAWYDSIPTLTTQSLQTFSVKKLRMNWDKAESFNAKKGNYWLITLPGQPTYQGVKQGYRKIAFLKDSTGHITARILEIIPDAQYFQRHKKVSTKDFTGRVFVYDTNYKLINGQIYSGGKQVGAIKPGHSDKLKTQMVLVSVSCDWYDSSYIDAEGVFTIHSESICSYSIYDDGFYNDGGGGGGAELQQDPIGGGGGGSAPAETPPPPAELPAMSKPGIVAKDYMKCFGNVPDAGATMRITVYVQEPWPGTSFNVGPNSVGHTAIGLTKTNGTTTINQTVGFYPSTLNYWGGSSKVVDNGGDMEYNVSISYNVTADQFNKIAAYIANPPASYDIDNFNCTNFAITACQQGGIALPNADSITGLNGAGGLSHAMTPAGLGGSIENLKGQNNVNTTGGTMPNSHGACN